MAKQNAGHEAKFGYISKLAIFLLSLPFSNASVERAFSIVGIIKDKLCNKMSINTADAIMRLRFLLPPGECVKFEPTHKMSEKFTGENVDKSVLQKSVLDAFNDVERL